ncbi:MAG: hypothetical protein RBT69_03025 [Spirochaetia bacterium]|jgi:hypothetical protein|nr:hypothetical protein [Spirochaetia bacterium]
MTILEKNQVASTKTLASVKKSACRLGFWVAILIANTTASAFIIAITTAPARSGPNCQPFVEMGIVESCIDYPYTDVADFVPIEYIWMYPTFLMALLFVVLVTCIHYYSAEDKKIFSHLGLSFALLSSTTHIINYFIQIAVMQPSLLKSELEGLSLFSQYNPHGIFIALEDVGYLMMGVAFLFIAFTFSRRNRLEHVIRNIFFISSVMVIGSLFLFALIYRSELEYRYEVFAIVIDWITLIVSGILLSVFFKREDRVLSKEEANRIGGISK